MNKILMIMLFEIILLNLFCESSSNKEQIEEAYFLAAITPIVFLAKDNHDKQKWQLAKKHNLIMAYGATEKDCREIEIEKWNNK